MEGPFAKARNALARWKCQIETPYADLSEKEKDSDSFLVFQKRVLKATKSYPHGTKLVAGMSKRMQKVVDKGGLSIGK